MTPSEITSALYSSSFVVISISVLFYSLVIATHSHTKKNDKTTTLGLFLTTFFMALMFFWLSLWRDAHASRDASLWMVDHPITWLSTIGICVGSVVILKGLTNEYWLISLFIGVISFTINLSL
jgi:uncharacterized membrane protein YidH (DUF202 family)